MALRPMLLALLLVSCATPSAVPRAPARLEAIANVIDISENGTRRPGSWTLDASQNPDVYRAAINRRGARADICFISGERAFCRSVGIGDSVDFVITHQGVDYPTRILGAYVPPAARFDAAYREANRGRVTILVPEAYELVNIAIALTPHARGKPFLVMRDTPYYRALEQYFAPVANHPFVQSLDRLLQQNEFRYSTLKMNAYAFDYDASGQVVRSAIYDRTGFFGSTTNDLMPMFEEMRSFSEASNFRAFYAAHRPFYESQVADIRQRIDIDRIVRWLRREFPAVRPYDHIKIVFSPLVYGSQSVTWLEDGDFRELQPHVNFPYPQNFTLPVSDAARLIQRGNLIFTEINHGFINPTADPYAQRIGQVMGDITHWANPTAAAGYGSTHSVFNEMMNWGLVNLYYVDHAPPADLEALIAANDRNQSERRGFIRFPEFSRFLVRLYRERPPGTTIADLYPRIIQWFADNAPAERPASPS